MPVLMGTLLVLASLCATLIGCNDVRSRDAHTRFGGVVMLCCSLVLGAFGVGLISVVL